MRKRPDNVERNKSEAQRLAIKNSHKDGKRAGVYKKISESMKGNTNGLGSVHPHSDETKLKLRKATLSLNWTGERHPLWKGGRAAYVKTQALLRDDYVCQICGFTEKAIMVVDHIKPKSIFPELQFEMNNLMTLCPNCHARKTIREKKTGAYKRSQGFQLP